MVARLVRMLSPIRVASRSTDIVSTAKFCGFCIPLGSIIPPMRIGDEPTSLAPDLQQVPSPSEVGLLPWEGSV